LKTALVLCPQWDAQWPAYALALLSALLKRRGHETLIIDLNREMTTLSESRTSKDFDSFPCVEAPWLDDTYVRENVVPAYRNAIESAVERILAADVKLVGFSLFFSNWSLSLYVAQELKRRDPAIRIVAGGPSCSKFDACLDLVRRGEIDAVIYGEADESYPALVETFAAEGELRSAPGVFLSDDPAGWTDKKSEIRCLDTLPYGDFSGFRMEEYPRGKSAHTCRGCVRRCVFCTEWRIGSYRRMSAERIFAEMEHQLTQHPSVREFIFADSLLNGDIKILEEFCRRVLSAGLETRWGGWAIVRTEMDEAFLTLMHQAGCRWLLFGIESGSSKILRDLSKHVAPELNGRVLSAAKRAGVETVASMMVGFPTETEKDFSQTLGFLTRYRDSFSIVTPCLFGIEELKAEAARYNLTDTEHNLFWISQHGENDFPVRLGRLKRFMELCRDLGIDVRFEGKISAQDFAPHHEAMSRHYRQWKNGRAAIDKEALLQ
jgi:radical SAM superfamily enzyme YgiQ (UPF0313 family)